MIINKIVCKRLFLSYSYYIYIYTYIYIYIYIYIFINVDSVIMEHFYTIMIITDKNSKKNI